ncbi:tumor protein p53-inducible nuclear protein 2 isoform X1 [Lingula anatina]|uniref:Tumor protein p53-inducible nuclear protein 2 isoform X1 n=1 Tax=Lingula anatina TaxID=7574 RepID=A0A1S3K1B2_LINAN|nr:tumor protein p53-inducible nuclear protein 2 isoform X1 [Lingula anatina]|eukprot:XP_013416423.1 tumor protein p53-inducible nuclear protein 2 isoform X1 [Lingula anatina]
MLSGLSNLIFGAGPEEAPHEAVDLKTTLAENEWVLVDRTNTSSTTTTTTSSSSTLTCTARVESQTPPPFSPSQVPLPSQTDNVPHIIKQRDHSNSSRDSQGSRGSSGHVQPDHQSPWDSWLVTPPPCFTAGSSRLETGPMENLLIEHPSMSVYGPRPRGSSTGADDSLDSESSTENEQNRPVIHRPPHRPRAVAARAGLVAAQAQAVKSMQRSHHQVTTRNLRKKQLTRANQVHERFSNAKALHQRKIKQPGTRKQQH